MKHERILVRNAETVTMDAALGDIAGCDILIDQGAFRQIEAGIPVEGVDRVIDGTGMIALPGLIDTHNCLWQTVLRGQVPDLWPGTYFTQLLPLRSRFRPEDNRHSGYIGGSEMLSYGTTTVVDYCHNVRGPGYADAAIEGLQATGIRHVFTWSFMSERPDAFADDAARFADARRVFERFHDPERTTTVNFGIESVGAPGLGAQLSFARALGVGSCIHANSPNDIAWLHARGLLGPDLLAIHGNLITDTELAWMKSARMPICFTPSADVQGTPADVVRRAWEHGVDVVFGCDVPCHVASDPMAQLRTIHAVQGYIDGATARARGPVVGRRPPVAPGMPLLLPRELLRRATIGAAEVLGMDARIGSITVGKRADLLLVRKGPFGSSVDPDPCAHVLLQTSPREIDTVLVDGVVRVREGRLVDFDAARAEAMIAESREVILGRAG